MEQAVIVLEQLTKRYGENRGVQNLSFAVNRGDIFGYLGPNGAGKTTTIRLLLDFLRPTEGHVTVLGANPRRQGLAVRRWIGYLPSELNLYRNLTVSEYLRYMANLRDGVEWIFVRSLAARLDLRLSQPISALSSGNHRKVGLVQALMHRPDLLILDEPTNGLDPLIQQEFHRLMREYHQDGGTIFLSSHNLPEVERMCQRVAVIREGELVAVEDIDTLKARAYRELEVHFGQPVPQAELQQLPGLSISRVEDRALHCSIQGSLDPLIKALAQYQVDNIVTHEPDLESIFLGYYGRGFDDDVA